MKYKLLLTLAIIAPLSAEAQCRRLENTRLPNENGEATIGVSCEAGEHLSGIYCNIIKGYGFTEQQLTGTGSGRCTFVLSDLSEPVYDSEGNFVSDAPAPIYEGTPRAQALCCR
jgi:hypothetical protein